MAGAEDLHGGQDEKESGPSRRGPQGADQVLLRRCSMWRCGCRVASERDVFRCVASVCEARLRSRGVDKYRARSFCLQPARRAPDIWHLWATEHSSITTAFIFPTTPPIDWLSPALQLSDRQQFCFSEMSKCVDGAHANREAVGMEKN